MPYAQGNIIGDRYILREVVGQGGMQQVWKATDQSLDRHVALKIPFAPSAHKRFTQSAQLSARIRHANVASALDYIADDTGEYYIEELIDGINLQYCMDQFFPRLDGDTAAHVMHHLAKGLAASHAVNVLHRDLKPSNIMVDRDLSFSTIKITDFGIAKLAESEMDRGTSLISSGITQGLSSTMLGAIPFLAPEVLRKNKAGAAPVGKPSDVWSLAALGYWLLAGEPPFGTDFDAVPGILSATPNDWPPSIAAKQLTASLVIRLQEIIGSCFKLNPSERPTVEQLVSELGSLAYLSGSRECGTITSSGPYGGVWFGSSDAGRSIMFHQAEVMAGGRLSIGCRVSFVATPGTPNRRAVAILCLR